jgi:hypothetical protein
MGAYMTEKQLNFVNKLLEQKKYVAIIDLSNLNKTETDKVIAFLNGDNSNYDQVTRYIRRRGPKLPNLIGEYLYEDF